MKTYAKTGKAPEWANQKQPPPSGRTSTPPPPPNQSTRRTSTPPPPNQSAGRTSTPPPPPNQSTRRTSTPPPPPNQSAGRTSTPPPPNQSTRRTSTPPPPNQSTRRTSTPPPPPNQSAGRGAPFNPDPTARAGSPGNSQTGYSTRANRGQPNKTSTSSSRTQQTSQKSSRGPFSWEGKRGGMWNNVPGYQGHFSVNVPNPGPTVRRLATAAGNVAQVAFTGKDIFDRTKERVGKDERLATAVPKSAAEAGAGLAGGLKAAALASKVLPKKPLINAVGSLAAGIGGYYAGAGAAEKIIKKFEQPAYTPEVLKYLRPNKP